MKMLSKIISIGFLTLTIFSLTAQESTANIKKRKHTFYVYWGWNRAMYSKSDLRLWGNDYDFTLEKIQARDSPTAFKASTYFGPTTLTIPQTNYKLGYFLNEKWSIAGGVDHMKYVMRANQVVKINGHISKSGTDYDGEYNNQDIVLRENFLKFEHTDGLNFGNIELRHHDKLLGNERFGINVLEGVGLGFLLPKTNATLLNNKRHDEFHLAGFGTSSLVGINFYFFKYLFIQTEAKGGYINMPSIRTTENASDKASQQFWYFQYNWSFGGRFSF